jgi:hypothetical protein
LFPTPEFYGELALAPVQAHHGAGVQDRGSGSLRPLFLSYALPIPS